MEKKLVYNLPEYAKNYKYVVVNVEDTTGKLWFYGAYNEVARAFEAASEVDFRYIIDADEVDFARTGVL